MSTSTVSITGNTPSAARRRPVERNQPSAAVDSATAAAGAAAGHTAGDSSVRLTAGDTATAILKDVVPIRKPPPNMSNLAKRAVPGRKSRPEKPRWLTAISIIGKNFALLLVVLGFVQMIRWSVSNSRGDGGIEGFSGDFDEKLAEMDRFVKKTMKAMQVQVDAVDKKIDNGMGKLSKEFDEKMTKKGEELDLKLGELTAKTENFEKFVSGFESKSLLYKEEFSEFLEEFRKGRKDGNVGEATLDDIKVFAREVVEKEIERHAADGLGMVDYALASGGAKVLKHSDPYVVGRLSGFDFWRYRWNSHVASLAENMLRPSFGEPGSCFPLKGGSGFVEIRLRTAIMPEAVTLEHVAKSVAYDRSSAPKHCRVSGWQQGQDLIETESQKMSLLTEFTYDLDKTNVQTFKVLDSAASGIVDTIRLDFASNHGGLTHTCIYRFRVHGREPSSVPMMAPQA